LDLDWPILSLQVANEDDSIVKVEIRAFNGRYAGTTAVWLSTSELVQFASGLAGFPVTTADERHFEFGHRRGERGPGGYLWVQGFCSIDLACSLSGAARATVYFEDDATDSSVSFMISAEAAEIGRFVSELKSLAALEPPQMVGRAVALSRSG
jgi:hypothetical protein